MKPKTTDVKITFTVLMTIAFVIELSRMLQVSFIVAHGQEVNKAF